MKAGLIYMAEIGGKFIVGSTMNIEARKSQYVGKLRRGVHNNKIVQNAWDKYRSISFSVLQDNIPEPILRHVEDIWIGAMGARASDRAGGMNLRDAHRCRLDESVREKISRSVRKMDSAIYQYGLDGCFIAEYPSCAAAENLTGVSRGGIGACCIGKKYTAGGFQWRNTKENEIPPHIHVYGYAQSIPVYQYSSDGAFIRSWKSQMDAAVAMGISNSKICSVCKGKRATAGGFVWSYTHKLFLPKQKNKPHPRQKSISQFSLDGEIIKVYDRLSDIDSSIFYTSNIVACCNGRAKTYKGYRWSYK